MLQRLLVGVGTIVLVQTLVSLIGHQNRIPRHEAASTPQKTAQTTHQLKMRLVECAVKADGSSTETVIGQPAMIVYDSHSAQITVAAPDKRGYSVDATPAIQADGRIVLNIGVRKFGHGGEKDLLCSGRRMSYISPATNKRMVGISEIKNKTIQKGLSVGKISTVGKEYSAMFVDVTDTVVPAPQRER